MNINEFMIKKITTSTLLIVLLAVFFFYYINHQTSRIEKSDSVPIEVEVTASSSEDYAYRDYRSNQLQEIKGLKAENMKVVMNETEILILLANDTQVYLLHIPSYEGRFITSVADPSHLHSLSYYSQIDNVFIDGINLYKLVGEDLIPLQIRSPENLRYSLYVRGTDRVFYGNEMIKEANPASFKIAASMPPRSAEDDLIPRVFYAKDANHVYYKGKVIPSAEAKSFDVYAVKYKEEYAYDAKNIYLNGEPILGANFNTFVILSDQPYEGCSLGKYSKDKDSVYYKTEKVDGADPATFKALLNEYGIDSKHSYFKGKMIDINPDKLEVRCDYG